MPFGWFKKRRKDKVEEKDDKKNETGEEFDLGEITTRLLLSVLESYPKHDIQHLHLLLAHPKTKKIATGILEGNVQNLSTEDFEGVARDGAFLHDCGDYLLTCGMSYGKRDFLNLAIGLFVGCRRYFKRGSDDYAKALVNEGIARGRLAELGVNPADNLEKALTLYDRARSEGVEKNTPDYAKALMNEGNARRILAELGVNPADNLEKALTLYDRARSEGVEKNTPDYAKALVNEGLARETLAELGVSPAENLETALTLYDRARSEGFEKNTLGYAIALVNEGYARRILAELGVNPADNLEKALILYDRARSEGFEKNTPDYARALVYDGIARERLAELGVKPAENLETASILYDRARSEGFEKNTPDYARALVYDGIARERLAELGVNPAENLETALTLYDRARSEGFEKNTPGYASALVYDGIARERLAELGVNPAENLETALILYDRARSEGFEKNTPNYARALMNEGNARGTLAELGVNPADNLEKALTLYDRARSEGVEKNTPDYAKALMNEGTARQILAELGVNPADNLNTAETMYLEAKDIFSQTNDIISLIKVNGNVGYLKYFTNEMREAYNYLREAIGLIEDMRASIKIPELRKEYFETVVGAYKKMVFTCLALGKDEEAFRYAESAKGRTFLELLASEKKRIKGDSELIGEYKDVLREIEGLETKHITGKEKQAEIEERDEQLQNLKRLHDDLLRKIKQSDPEYYSIKTVEPISPDELSGILNGRTLVEYFVGDKLAIFVVNGGLTVKEKEINEKELLEKVFEFRELISKLESHLKNGTNPDETEESKKAEKILTDFYTLLIAPIKKHLSEEVVIVPHSHLHLIPFQALKGDKYLIEDYKVCFAQSASSLEFLKEGAGEGSLVVGNPTKDLRFAEIEASEVAEILNTKPIIRDDAKRDRIVKEMKNKEILHLSCHGLFDAYNPAFSRVILSDGSITARDFMDLEMDANLTVLSACETALAEIARGDEVEGLVRAIQYGGCRFVIASLWKVEDRSTKELFLKFYTEGGDIVGGIREAELSLMKEYGFYFWAPFQVYGISI